MKNTIIIASLAAMAALASCGKEDTPQAGNKYSGQTVPVEIMIGPLMADTRAGFFDDVAEFTAGVEKQLRIIDIYVFNSEREQVLYKRVAPAGADRFMATLELPRELCGTTCTVYASANADVSLSNTPPIYNAYYNPNLGFPHRTDTFEEMMSEEYWSENGRQFIMSATKEVEVQPYGFKTYVSMELTRVEAKIALRLKVSDDFTAIHNGATLDITGVRLTNLSRYVYLFRDKPYEMWNDSQTQQPYVDRDGYHHYLFYIFPRGTYVNPVTGVIHATYDYDGDASTTDDRSQVEVKFLVSQTGEVQRNHYYRIDALIKGVGEYNLDLDFMVRPWTEVDSNLEIGS